MYIYMHLRSFASIQLANSAAEVCTLRIVQTHEAGARHGADTALSPEQGNSLRV